VLCRAVLCCAVCRSIDQLNRERKLQQSAAGSELRVLEDQYYSALRKNLEISAACQAVEDDMASLQASVDKLAGKQQQQEQAGAAAAGDGGGEQQQNGQPEQQQQQEGDEQSEQQQRPNGVSIEAAAAAAAAAEPMEQ
jgi:pre-mRNA-splicing factor SPF27